MGRFCKFCGNPLEDGMECSCEGAVKERQEAAPVDNVVNMTQETTSNNVENNQDTVVNNVPVTPVTNTQNNGQQYAGNGQPYAGNAVNNGSNIDAAKILADALNLAKEFLKNPFLTLKSAFVDNNKQSQLVSGCLSAIVMFVLMFMMFNYPIFDSGTKFKIAFSTVLFYAVTKAIYACGVYFFAKNQSKTVSYMSVLGLFSLTTILDTIILLIMILFMTFSFYEFVTIGLVFFFINNIISSVVITYIVFEENFVKTYRVSLILQLIMTCIVILLINMIGRNILMDMITNSFGSMDYLRMFRKLY